MSNLTGSSSERLWKSAPVLGGDWRDRTRINARRVRAGWADWLGHIPWHTFATLTFDPRRSPDTSERAASREAFWWCGQIGRWERKPVGWAYAVEGGGGDHIHAHALIVGCSDSVWPAMEATWRARNGRIDLRRVTEPEPAAQYVCKAIGSNGEIAFSDTLDRYRPEGRRPGSGPYSPR